MSESSDDFAGLLTRARAGDEAALARLAREYEPKVRIVAHVLLGPALRPYLDSLDLVQSVHRSLIVGLRGVKYDFATPEQLVALAVTMLRRKAARHWRHLRRQRRAGSDPDGGLPNWLAALSSPQPGPARQAEFRDGVECLCRGLSDLERKILELRSCDYTCAEVARELGLNPIALRVRLTRLRKRLHDSGILSDWL